MDHRPRPPRPGPGISHRQGWGEAMESRPPTAAVRGRPGRRRRCGSAAVRGARGGAAATPGGREGAPLGARTPPRARRGGAPCARCSATGCGRDPVPRASPRHGLRHALRPAPRRGCGYRWLRSCAHLLLSPVGHMRAASYEWCFLHIAAWRASGVLSPWSDPTTVKVCR
ncbi:hypothetical protein SLNWT_1058 [Streptomyces albus]|uniref:Uncharacterized protein n=1 Tax=Streptomyces albus (strain ATCC 21838 / DSM 41398 / FERM P-419 / JCM 4703 / NBRC 107858) TaxID=1081613 RepID=A0A0B5EIX5_STRA4|nr:hypothetical protein SLNWT_1058 [Streptomyces albus]AOU75750.1 hypothetical protein SLNHY_1059 [Streptomyces albus]AYN31553.1 hypothetical protein DUI70_1050 [Streptomyces albus]